MKLIRIIRTGTLRANEISQESFEFQEKNKHFLVLRPNERSNKQLPKDSIMNPTADIDIGSTHLFAVIWCFDFQESEAKERLEECVSNAIEKKKESLNKELSNIELLKERIKTETINVSY